MTVRPTSTAAPDVWSGPPAAVVLAAGKGTRMRSELPKVLVPVRGRPMLDYVLEALQAAGIGRIVVVVGYRRDLIETHLAGRPGVECVVQEQQLGTGHAVRMAEPVLAEHPGPVLVVAGDSPMIQPDSLKRLLAEFTADRAGCLLGTCRKPDPFGLGRIVRDAAGRFERIVEEKDASPAEKLLDEVNLSCYVFAPRPLFAALGKLRTDNVQGEFYLTDVPLLIRREGFPVDARAVLLPREALSINSPEELAAVERVLDDERP